MITKTELFQMDLSPLAKAVDHISDSIVTNEVRLDLLHKTKALLMSGMTGQTGLAACARVAALEEAISSQIASMEQTRDAIETYCINKTALQQAIVAYVAQLEALQLEVTETWQVKADPAKVGILAFGVLAMRAVQSASVLHAKVITFQQYDFTAAIAASATNPPYVTSGGYSTEEPDRTLKYDDYYPYGSKKGQATATDYAKWAAWGTLHEGAKAIGGMPDASRMYEHFRSGTGTPMTFDYGKAYDDDAGVRNHVNNEINNSLQAANEAVQSGHTDVTLHSPMHDFEGYPTTENWQKTIGDHNTYTETKVEVQGDTVTTTITVHARDKYNFNGANAKDVRSGLPDADNGRFEELGWARSFETSGSMTKTYTWKVGEQPPHLDTDTTQNTERTR